MFALARVFGNIPEDLFSRSDEQAIFRAVAKAGLGPKLLVGFAACCMTRESRLLGTACVAALTTTPRPACTRARQHAGASADAVKHRSNADDDGSSPGIWYGICHGQDWQRNAVQLGFGNGRLEEFYVHCKCLTPEQMREPEVSCALAVR